MVSACQVDCQIWSVPAAALKHCTAHDAQQRNLLEAQGSHSRVPAQVQAATTACEAVVPLWAAYEVHSLLGSVCSAH